MNVPGPSFRILTKNTGQTDFKDATADLTPYLLSLKYIDNLTGKADELHIEVDNTDYRFLNRWYLNTGMIIRAYIGQMYCGEFTIDETAQYGPPHEASFRAQSAEYSGPIRVPTSYSHQSKSLSDIVSFYAKKYGLKQIGEIPVIQLKTIVQMHESDIDFLHRLAEIYGCNCSIKGGVLVFDKVENQWTRNTVKDVHFGDIMRYHFLTSLPDTSDAVASAYYDQDGENPLYVYANRTGWPYKLTVAGWTALNNGQPIPAVKVPLTAEQKFQGKYIAWQTDYDTQSNVIKVQHHKVESRAEAERVVIGCLAEETKRKHTCTVTVPGNELFVAGNSINILGLGKRSGYWAINSSTHHITKRGGYITILDLSHGAATTEGIAPEEETIELDPNTPGMRKVHDNKIF